MTDARGGPADRPSPVLGPEELQRLVRVDVLVAGVGAACFFQFGSGPRELWRDRLLVIAPVFLVAAPGIVGLNDLGAGPIVAILSGAAGFGAAVLLGTAVASRRR